MCTICFLFYGHYSVPHSWLGRMISRSTEWGHQLWDRMWPTTMYQKCARFSRGKFHISSSWLYDLPLCCSNFGPSAVGFTQSMHISPLRNRYIIFRLHWHFVCVTVAVLQMNDVCQWVISCPQNTSNYMLPLATYCPIQVFYTRMFYVLVDVWTVHGSL